MSKDFISFISLFETGRIYIVTRGNLVNRNSSPTRLQEQLTNMGEKDHGRVK
jgi:hypothetical protein